MGGGAIGARWAEAKQGMEQEDSQACCLPLPEQALEPLGEPLKARSDNHLLDWAFERLF